MTITSARSASGPNRLANSRRGPSTNPARMRDTHSRIESPSRGMSCARGGRMRTRTSRNASSRSARLASRTGASCSSPGTTGSPGPANTSRSSTFRSPSATATSRKR